MLRARTSARARARELKGAEYQVGQRIALQSRQKSSKAAALDPLVALLIRHIEHVNVRDGFVCSKSISEQS